MLGPEVHLMASVLVAYATRLGSTRGIADAIGQRLRTHGHHVLVRDVHDDAAPGQFDAVVLGSGVFAGHWHKPAVEYARRHEAELATRPVWLFSSGPVGEARPNQALPDPGELNELRRKLRPVDHRVFWGALDRSAIEESDLGFLERQITERFIPEGDWRDWPAIDAWADDIARRLMPALVI
jgi:menaquinone-dependent protoporphyrinogen oxidase